MLLKGSSNGSATKDSISSSEPNMHAAKVKEEAERMIKQKEHLMGVEMAAVISDICGRSGMLLCKLTDRMGQEAKMLRKEVEVRAITDNRSSISVQILIFEFFSSSRSNRSECRTLRISVDLMSKILQDALDISSTL